MLGRRRLPGFSLLAAVALLGGISCGPSDVGLGDPADASAVLPGSVPACMVGTIDRANWPASADFESCSKTCGPDDLGQRTCSQMALSTCRTMSGCVCVSSPCVTCAECEFAALPDCYVPVDAELALPCAATVVKGDPCSPSCARILCLHGDGKTACVCNAQGKYACARWGDGAWK